MLTSQGFIETNQAINDQPGIQLLPHSFDAEIALLGSLVIDPSQMLDVGYLDKSDFYLLNNGQLYEAMKTLFEKHQGYDWLTVTEHLRAAGHLEDIGGEVAISDLMDATPTSYGAPEYAAIVYRHSVSRQVINETMAIAQAAFENDENRTGEKLVNGAIDRLSSIEATRNISGAPQTMRNGAEALFDRRQAIIANGGKLPGLMTGIKTLDNILDGLEKKRLYLLAGRPGMGKSALALQVAYNIASANSRVLLFSLEMEEIEITARLASIRCAVMGSKIPYKDILAGRGEETVICQAIDYVSRLPINIDTTPGLTVAQIRNRTQKIMMTEGIDLLIIDHGGLITPSRRVGNSYNDTNLVAAELQTLPKQLRRPVLCLLQLSRDFKGRGDKRPMLTDLRDTGKWEENADGVLFIHRDQYHNPDTEFPHLGEIIVAKNRSGRSSESATVYADVALNRFVDLETREVRI